MKTIVVIAWLQMLVLHGYSKLGVEFCQETAPQPTIVPVLPNTYQTNVECNLVDKNLTANANIVASSDKALMRIARENKLVTYLFDFKQNQLLIWTDLGGECIARSLSDSYDALLMIPIIKGDWLRYNNIFNGSTTIRGIKANKWHSCHYMTEIQTIVDIDFYFSAPPWKPPYSEFSLEVPLRIEVHGRQYLNINGSEWNDFNHIYDFHDYKADIQAKPYPTMFQTPPGFFCSYSRRGYEFPIVPEIFSFNGERFDSSSQAVRFDTIWYDINKKMVKFKGKLSDKDAEEITVLDFNTGIKYQVAVFTEMCTRTLIQPGDNMAAKHSGTQLRMLSTKEFLHAEPADIQYIGKRQERGIMCDVWIGRYFDDDAKENVTREWYFSTSNWFLEPGIIKEFGALIKMQTYQVKEEMLPTVKETINVQRFDETENDWEEFEDIQKCIAPENKIRFIITFYIGAQGNDVRAMNKKLARRKIRDQIANKVNIRALRIVNAEFTYDGAEHTFFYATLLDRPSVINDKISPTLNEPGLNSVYESLHREIRNGLNFPEQLVYFKATFLEKITFTSNHNPTPVITPTAPSTVAPTLSSVGQNQTIKVPPTRSTRIPHTLKTTKSPIKIPTTPNTPPTLSATTQAAYKIPTKGFSQKIPTPTQCVCPIVASCGTVHSIPTSSASTKGSSNTKIEVPDSSSYSAGEMAGLGIGMACLGVLLGAALVKLCYARRRTDSLSMTLVEIQD